MAMRQRFFYWLLLLPLLLPTMAANAKTRIGIVTEGQWARLTNYVTTTQQEIRDLLGDEFDVEFVMDSSLDGDWQLGQIQRAVNNAFRRRDIDMVITAGPLVSEYAVQRTAFPKPTIVPVIVDAKAQQVPREKNGSSGIKNLVYLDPFTDVGRDLRIFRDYVKFRHLAVVADREFIAALAGMDGRLLSAAEDLGIELTIIPATSQPNEALLALPADADAVLVLPLLRFSSAAIRELADGFIARGLPSFSTFGKPDVEQGILLSATSGADVTRIARRIALNVQQILLGSKASKLNVRFPPDTSITLNQATASRLQFSPGWRLLEEAELIAGDQLPKGRSLTLPQAMLEASLNNIDLAVQQAELAAGRADIRTAAGRLLPQVNLAVRGRIIDRDRAAASFGTQAQRRVDAVVTLQQLLYNEDALAARDNALLLQQARAHDRSRLQLDIAAATAEAYLNLLRASTLEKVERDNFKVTRANLKRSEIRQQVGISGRADVLRWQTAIARGRQAVLDASARSRQARVQLNRLLQRPLEEAFLPLPPSLNDPKLLVGTDQYLEFVDNPRDFARFREFMAAEAVRNSPELKAVDATLVAGQRSLKAAQRNKRRPKLGVSAEYGYRLYEGGAGDEFNAGSLPPGANFDFGSADDNDWQVGIEASLPLFAGGTINAAVDRSAAELNKLVQQRAALVADVRQRQLNALLATGASQPAIRLSEEAAEAARGSLEIVTQAYSRGAVSIIELLDAQNSALAAEQAAANANYDFLLDLMAVQRAFGQFDYFMTTGQRAEFFARLTAWFEKNS